MINEEQEQDDVGEELQEDQDIPGDDTHAEAWQEDQPPEDDFHDQMDSVDESEGTSATAYEEVQPKKSGKGIFTVIVLVALLVVGGLGYWQFRSGGIAVPQGSAKVQQAEVKQDPGTGAPAGAVPSETPVAPMGGEADLSGIYGAHQSQAGATPADLVAAQMRADSGNSAGEVSALPNVPLASPATSTPAVAGTSVETPVAGPTKPQLSAKEAEMPKKQGDIQAPQAAVPSTALREADVGKVESETRLKDLAEQIESLKKSFAVVSQQNKDIVARLDTLSSPDASALNERLDRIEKKLATLVQLPASAPKTEPEKKAPAATAFEPKKIEAQQPVSGPKKAAAVKKETSKKKTTTKIKTAEKPKYILRAATPDAAWVAPLANPADLRRVAPGDTLPGLGKVNAIRQTGDKWEIIGTEGALR